MLRRKLMGYAAVSLVGLATCSINNRDISTPVSPHFVQKDEETLFRERMQKYDWLLDRAYEERVVDESQMIFYAACLYDARTYRGELKDRKRLMDTLETWMDDHYAANGSFCKTQKEGPLEQIKRDFFMTTEDNE